MKLLLSILLLAPWITLPGQPRFNRGDRLLYEKEFRPIVAEPEWSGTDWEYQLDCDIWGCTPTVYERWYVDGRR